MRLSYLFVCVLILCAACKQESESVKSALSGQAFGTTYGVQFYDGGQDTETIANGLDSIFNATNNSVSTYLPNSDISKINRGNDSLVVDQIFVDNFRLSQKIYEQSNGYFDPTIGVLRNAYGFGNDAPLKVIDSTVIDSLMTMVGFEKVSLREDHTIQKQHPLIYFDFNAVAKGYAVDQIADYLESFEIANYVVELGGEIRAKGKNLNKDAFWVAGIEAVDSPIDDRRLMARVALDNRAMASSGNYRKFREDPVTGQRFVHTINPLTGSAARSDVTSATVFAATCAQADAYATSFMAMGIERSKELLKELDQIEVYLTYLDANGNTQIFISPQLEQRLLK